MEVSLYVYDLSQGLARQLSGSLLGTQIDAVYHTSIVFDGIEYFFGLGIQTCSAGTTHHGRPMEVISLGRTDLPMEIILEYLDSMKETFTPESYDLFRHNCNNFSDEFAKFLVGRGIPSHITSLPQTVLNTPFGQMLAPQLDQSMRNITQAPLPAGASAVQAERQAENNGNRSAAALQQSSAPQSKVHNVTRLEDVERLLASASNSCACIFFTSSTCAPCKLVYPDYEELALEAGDKATLIKVDINYAQEVASKYKVHATPTFMTFLKGKKQEEWAGSDPSRLNGTIHLLVQQAFPPHPHSKLSLSKFLGESLKPTIYQKSPPLDKLIPKMGDAGKGPVVTNIATFIKARDQSRSGNARLPDLNAFSPFLREATALPPETLFPVVDLARVALSDTRVSDFFLKPLNAPTIHQVFTKVNSFGVECPYSLRLVTLQLASNLFVSPNNRAQVLATFGSSLTALLASSFLDDKHPQTRAAAANLSLNMCQTLHQARINPNYYSGPDEPLGSDDQVELVASLLETVAAETENKHAVKAMILSIGYLVYYASEDSAVIDLCAAMNASETVKEKANMGNSKQSSDPDFGSVREIGTKLLASN